MMLINMYYLIFYKFPCLEDMVCHYISFWLIANHANIKILILLINNVYFIS